MVYLTGSEKGTSRVNLDGETDEFPRGEYETLFGLVQHMNQLFYSEGVVRGRLFSEYREAIQWYAEHCRELPSMNEGEAETGGAPPPFMVGRDKEQFRELAEECERSIGLLKDMYPGVAEEQRKVIDNMIRELRHVIRALGFEEESKKRSHPAEYDFYRDMMEGKPYQYRPILNEPGSAEHAVDNFYRLERIHEDAEKIRKLAKLSERENEIWMMRANGYGFKRIAQDTGMTEGAVKTLYKRAENKMEEVRSVLFGS